MLLAATLWPTSLLPAVQLAKPVGSDICLDAVRRLRQLLSNYDEPPFKEAVAGGCLCFWVCEDQVCRFVSVCDKPPSRRAVAGGCLL